MAHKNTPAPTCPALQFFNKLYALFKNIFQIKKNPLKKILKIVTDPDLGPAVNFLTIKWKRNEGQCFQNSNCTSMLISFSRAHPSVFFEGGLKTQETAGGTGWGRASGQAQWFRQHGSRVCTCQISNLLPRIRWSSSSGIQPPCHCGKHCWFTLETFKAACIYKYIYRHIFSTQ